MADFRDLDAFVAAAKGKGAEDGSLAQLLEQYGWPSKEVYRALGRYYESATGLTVPAPGSRMESAREAFFYLLVFLTLSSWAFAVGSIWFQRIEDWFADPLAPEVYYGRDLSYQIAAILVAFPAYVIAMRAVLREQATNPDKAESAVRRWLTNLALLITALVVIGDLISFLARFLSGGLSWSFALKSLVVCVIAGAIFWYYTAALRAREAD